VRVLVASADAVLAVDPESPDRPAVLGLERRKPVSLAVDHAGRVWCGTFGHGLFVTGDGGETWEPAGLEGRQVTAIAVGAAVLYAGTEPSAVFRSDDGGATWHELEGLLRLPSAPTWSFPPRPDTHHVRCIVVGPLDPERIHVAIEAGALVRSRDGGRSWEDRVPGSPIDSHAIATHAAAPERLWAAAGDGWFESQDGGDTWRSPDGGLADGYCWGVAVDSANPEVVVLSAALGPRSAHQVSAAESRVYRREDAGPWRRVEAGLPEPRGTTTAVLAADPVRGGVFWAASNRGLTISEDDGRSWRSLEIAWPAGFGKSRVNALALLRD
jgi:photosystem II stability/assembly factor-like uncharacterized protein